MERYTGTKDDQSGQGQARLRLTDVNNSVSQVVSDFCSMKLL